MGRCCGVRSVEVSGCGGRVKTKIWRLRMDEKCWWRKENFKDLGSG